MAPRTMRLLNLQEDTPVRGDGQSYREIADELGGSTMGVYRVP